MTLDHDDLLRAIEALEARNVARNVPNEPYWVAIKPPWYRPLARFNYWRFFSRPMKRLMKEFEC